MSSVSDKLQALEQTQNNLLARVAAQPLSTVYQAFVGSFVAFGCKVTEGTTSTDYTIKLEGQALGDESHLNPDIAIPPIEEHEYPNIAFAYKAFVSDDLRVKVEAGPTTGLARYDIASLFMGVAGPGFAVATGTPSSATKTDYDTNGLKSTPYDAAYDPTLPIGALPVARIYIEDVFIGIANAQIADLRSFDGRLKGARGEPFVYEDLTQIQKDALASGAIEDATIQANNAAENASHARTSELNSATSEAYASVSENNAANSASSADLSAVAAAADVVTTSNNVTISNTNKNLTAADAIATGNDKKATTADRVQTGLAYAKTNANVVTTKSNVTATITNAANALASENAAAIILQKLNSRFVTDTEKFTWNSKPDNATDIGLGRVNTSGASKPISTATQTSMDGKVDDNQILTNVNSE